MNGHRSELPTRTAMHPHRERPPWFPEIGRGAGFPSPAVSLPPSLTEPGPKPSFPELGAASIDTDAPAWRWLV